MDLVVMAEDAAPLKKVTSSDIKMGIRNSFSGGYQTFFEVGNDTGTRVTRHADAVAIGIWPSTGHQIHGFEVKVSRTDFLNEMKDPAKSQAIFKFCHRWSLATPPGLVKVDELPPNWGLVTFDGKSLRTVKQAPLLTPEPLSPGFVAALVRRAGEVDDSLITAAQNKTRLEMEATFKQQMEQRVQRHSEDRRGEFEAAVKFRDEMRMALGDDWMNAHSVPGIVEAYRLAKRAELTGSYSSVDRLIGELEGAAQRVRSALGDMGVDLKAKRKSA